MFIFLCKLWEMITNNDNKCNINNIINNNRKSNSPPIPLKVQVDKS